MMDVFSALRERLSIFRHGQPDSWTSPLVWVVLGLSVLSVLPVFLITKSLTDEVERNRLVAAAEEAASSLAHEIDLNLANIRALKGLFQGSVHVSRDEFSSFVRALRPSESVQSLEWLPRVPAAARAEMEDAVRKEGYPDFRIHEYSSEGAIVPARQRPEYFPVYYLQSAVGNDAILGLDLGSNPVSLDALHRARDSGEQTASGRITLPHHKENQYGILIFEPIYTETALSLDARIEQLEGFVLGVFRITDLIKLAIPEEQFQVAVVDLSAAPDEQQLFPATDIVEKQPFQHSVSVKIADRYWSVRLAPATASALSTLPWFAAATWLAALVVIWTSRELISSRRHSQQLADVNHRLEALSDQRQDAIKELKRSNQELDDFAYIASHDLKEPLRAIHNHARFLLEDYDERLEEDGKMRLQRLIALSNRMEKLIADLLYFSRLGRGEAALETIDLNVVIADIQTHLAEVFQRKNVRISIARPLPNVGGHEPHMTALFQNLICNGIKYNESKEKLIEIGYLPAEGVSHLDSDITFYVRDNGIGIDDQFKDDVFRIFKRLNSEKAYGEGTGAGLSFVKKIVERQNGSIWLTSTIGEGTTFYFTLRRSSLQPSTETQLRAA